MRRAGPSASAVLFWQAVLGVTVLTVWQTLVSLKVLDAFFVSRPSDIAQRIAQWIVTGSLWGHLAVTLEESLLGLLAGSAMGISLGFSLGRSPMMASILDPYIKMLNAVPRVVLAPLFATQNGLDAVAVMPHGLTRSGSSTGATPGMSESKV